MTRGPTFRPRKLLEINAAYEAFVAAGFPVTLGGNAETLQVARDVDRTNWLVLQSRALRQIAAGNGDTPQTTFVQTTANRRYFMSYAEQLDLLDAMEAWSLAAWQNWNALKDAARAAASDDELRAIDVNAGYP